MGSSGGGLALLKGRRRCTVHRVRGEEERAGAAADWATWAAGNVSPWWCRRLDARRRLRGEKRRRAGGMVVCQLLDAKTGRGIGVGVHRGGLWLVRERSLGWCCSVVRVADRRERPGPGREVTDVAVAMAACLVTTGGRRAGVSDGE
jgi:hypothetical protein